MLISFMLNKAWQSDGFLEVKVTIFIRQTIYNASVTQVPKLFSSRNHRTVHTINSIIIFIIKLQHILLTANTN